MPLWSSLPGPHSWPLVTWPPQPAASARDGQLSCGLARGRQARLLGHAGVQVATPPPPTPGPSLGSERAGHTHMALAPNAAVGVCGLGECHVTVPGSRERECLLWSGFCHHPRACVSSDPRFLKPRDVFWRQEPWTWTRKERR